jgi:hypothetical protein
VRWCGARSRWNEETEGWRDGGIKREGERERGREGEGEMGREGEGEMGRWGERERGGEIGK